MERAKGGGLGAHEGRLADGRAAEAGHLARFAIDVDEDDSVRRLEGNRGATRRRARHEGRPGGQCRLRPAQTERPVVVAADHTTASSAGLKPTNHASRRSLVVPVLPAAGSVKPAARPRPLVERRREHVGHEERRLGPRHAPRRTERQRQRPALLHEPDDGRPWRPWRPDRRRRAGCASPSGTGRGHAAGEPQGRAPLEPRAPAGSQGVRTACTPASAGSSRSSTSMSAGP